MKSKQLYALDFDGVICNSVVETAMTGWKAAQTLWPELENMPLDNALIAQLQSARPCLEFGYEAILVMRLLQQGVSMSEKCSEYQSQIKGLIKDHNFNSDALSILFGRIRDAQIVEDEATWIANNPLFSGIAEKLRMLDQDDWLIVTTKQERFVSRILEANDIELNDERIFGLDRKLNKQAVLTQLQKDQPDRPVTFIEDRLSTLLGILKNPNLLSVKLQLVDWGYNTDAERNHTSKVNIEVIGIDEFCKANYS